MVVMTKDSKNITIVLVILAVVVVAYVLISKYAQQEKNGIMSQLFGSAGDLLGTVGKKWSTWFPSETYEDSATENT